jgi:putative ABC transport system substrate-binding protein
MFAPLGGHDVKRRDFLTLVGATAAWPTVALTQGGGVARLGVLVLGNPDPEPFMKELREGLRELGYVEGQNIQFEFRSAQGKPGNLVGLAAELVTLKVDMLIGFQTPAVTAAKQVTGEIPVVMGSAGDPVGTGLVASIARPGGNVTGVSGASAELGGKTLELIREVMPSARRVAALANATDPFHKPFLKYIQAAAPTLRMQIKPVLVRSGEELSAAFPEIQKSGGEAVVMQPSLPHRQTANLALKHRLPLFSANSNIPIEGGLMSYSADLPALYRETATFVDKILKGRKPADLPVQLPTKFLLVINLKTAAALGMTVPGTMLTRADQVIE